MNLWFRILGVLIASLFKPRSGVLEEVVLRGRVWPTDLDINVHMNNARFLAVMDLGRVDHAMRTGIMRMFIRRQWRPVIGAAHLRFRRPLRPFQPFSLHTRFVGWDERRMYVEHRIEAGGAVACHALMWVALIGPKRHRVTTAEILRELGLPEVRSSMPDWVGRFTEIDQGMETATIRDKAAE